MLLIFDRASSHVPLKILSIEDGTVLKSFNHLLHRNKKVDFIEQFNEKLLVKQENENLQILDVCKAHLCIASCLSLLQWRGFIETSSRATSTTSKKREILHHSTKSIRMVI